MNITTTTSPEQQREPAWQYFSTVKTIHELKQLAQKNNLIQLQQTNANNWHFICYYNNDCQFALLGKLNYLNEIQINSLFKSHSNACHFNSNHLIKQLIKEETILIDDDDDCLIIDEKLNKNEIIKCKKRSEFIIKVSSVDGERPKFTHLIPENEIFTKTTKGSLI